MPDFFHEVNNSLTILTLLYEEKKDIYGEEFGESLCDLKEIIEKEETKRL